MELSLRWQGAGIRRTNQFRLVTSAATVLATTLPESRIQRAQASRWCICLPHRGRWVCCADFQSAVSPTCSRQGVGSVPCVGASQRLAEYNAAIQRGSVRRSAFSAKRATGVFKYLAAGDAAAGHRPALRKIFTAPRRFPRILIKCNSALQSGAKQIPAGFGACVSNTQQSETG
jgi:hypothetical protein